MRILSLLLVVCSLGAYSQNIQTHEIQSEVLDQSRKIWVYTPWQYEEFPEKKMEVFYVFDSQARQYFDWVHATLQFFESQQFSFIVVGVESPFIEEKNQSRNTDLLPTATHPETRERYGPYAGGADKFKAYLQSEVMSFMEQHYRTLPHRAAIGHSNGGTFLSHCLLDTPELFDAYIMISPNFAYDQAQMVDRFKALSPEQLPSKKFLYISKANENFALTGFWKGWEENNQAVMEILKAPTFKEKLHLVFKDFSATESHGSTFPVSGFHALKAYFNYQFRTGENIIAYFNDLVEQGLVQLNPDLVNGLAYECFWNNRPQEALTVIHWAIEKFPNENNLYDSQGEFYEKLGELKASAASYQKAIEVLVSKKGSLAEKDYQETLAFYEGNLKRVKR